MASDLLQICKDAADEIGIRRPASVIGSTNQTIRRLLTMSNAEGEDLAKAADWTVLQRLHSFTTTDGEDEYALPSDYSRLIRNTEWDRENSTPIVGPLTPQEWQSIKSGLIGTVSVSRRYRIIRSDSSTSRVFRIDPTPDTDDETLVFEYISKNWCSNAAGSSTQSEWALDTDLSLLDKRLMVLGMIVRFKRSKGLDYAS